MKGRRHERGLALVVVLWAVAALSLIAGAMLALSLNAAHISHNAWDAARLENAANSGVQAGILSLFEPNPTNRVHLDGRPRQVRFDGHAVTIAIQDEAGRIDINYAPRSLLHDYIRSAGVDATQVEALANSIVDWRARRNSNVVTPDDTSRSRHGFETVADMMQVAGMTPTIYERLAPGVTVYSHQASFDTRVATREALLAIPGMNWQLATASVAANAPSAAVSGHAYDIVAIATRGQSGFTREAVILLTGNPARPYMILNWK
jgi:general secretion pathway protein K